MKRAIELIDTNFAQAMNVYNGQERTFAALAELVRKSGWRVIKVVQSDVGYDLIQGVPM